MWATPNTPNLADYAIFLQNAVGIDPAYLPPGSPFLGYAFNRAMNLVINVPTKLPGIEYTLALYNCAAHIQLTITPDQVINGTPYTFFRDIRKDFDLMKPIVGLPLSTSDESTSTTNAVPDALRQLTISDLGFMRTLWGREYLSYQQDFGPTVWGLT